MNFSDFFHEFSVEVGKFSNTYMYHENSSFPINMLVCTNHVSRGCSSCSDGLICYVLELYRILLVNNSSSLIKNKGIRAVEASEVSVNFS